MIDNRQNDWVDPITAGSDQGWSLPLLDYLQLLWFRRRLIVAITLFVAIIGYIQVNEIKDVYSATSTLMVNVPETQVLDIEAVLSRNNRYNKIDVETEIEVLTSRVLAEKVIQKLNLLSYPDFNPVLREREESLFDFLSYLNPKAWIPSSWKRGLREAMGRETQKAPVVASPEEREQNRQSRELATATAILLGGLRVAPVGDSSVINITFSALDPKLAAKVANELPEVYILDQLESKFEATAKANEWLTGQLAGLEAKVVESERAVEIYRDEHGLAEGPGMSIQDAQLSELNSQLIIARAEKAEVEARLTQLRQLYEGGGAAVQSASEVMSSPLIQQLRKQEAEALSRASELSLEFGPKHPRMLQVRAELDDIEERIHNEIGRILTGLENEASFARTRVASLENSLREAQGETSEQNKEAIQLRALQREAVANRTLYETFLNRFKETSATEGLQTSDARILSKAEVPGRPSYPNRNSLLTNYVLLGFLGACGLVLALQLLNPGITSPEQAQQLLGEYVIGLIPLIQKKVNFHDVVLDKSVSSLNEALNSLKFSLALSDPDHPVKAISVTSSVPEEGKTSLAIVLARVVSMSGQKVLIADGDLRRSTIGKRLGLQGKHKGLSDLVVAGDTDFSEFILKDEKGGVDYLPPGTAEFANASDIFASHRMQHIIDLLKSRYDLIVIDTPPVMAVADARIIGRVVDKTVFVVRWDKTPRKVARAAMEQLHRADVDIAGVVLQQVDLKRYGRVGYGDSGYYYHYGRYGKYYSS